MLKTSLVILGFSTLLFALAPPTQARLGETPTELCRRYGQPTLTGPGQIGTAYQFAFSGYLVAIITPEGIAVSQ